MIELESASVTVDSGQVVTIVISCSTLSSQNTSESANDFGEAAQDRDRTEVSTVERQAPFLNLAYTSPSVILAIVHKP